MAKMRKMKLELANVLKIKNKSMHLSILKSSNPRQTSDVKDPKKKVGTPFMSKSTVNSKSCTRNKVEKEDILDQGKEIQKLNIKRNRKKTLTSRGSLKTTNITWHMT